MEREYNIFVDHAYKELLKRVSLKDGSTEDEVKEILNKLYGDGLFHGMEEDMGCGIP